MARREHEGFISRASAGHPPLGEISSERLQEPNGAGPTSLGVANFTESQRLLDKQGAVPNISPGECESFAGTKTGVGEHRDERRVPLPALRQQEPPDVLDGLRRQR